MNWTHLMTRHQPKTIAGTVWLMLLATSTAQFQVTGITPVPHGMTAHTDAPIRISFDRPLDPLTVDAATFGAFGRWSGPVSGSLSLEDDNRVVVLQPSRPLSAGDLVTVRVADSVRAADGSALRAGGYSQQYWTRSLRVSNLIYNPIASMPTGTPSRPYGGVATDLNDDGWLDLTIVNEDTSDLRVFMNQADGQGTFAPYSEPTYPVGRGASPSEVADFDGDGRVDLAVLNFSDNSISVVLGDGTGGFLPSQTIDVGATPRGIATLDVDGDGDTDIVNTNRDDGNLSIFTNDGSGMFGEAGSIEGGVSGEWSLMAGDMNGDGRMDLVTAGGVAAGIRVLTANGDGTFTPQPMQDTGGRSWQIMLGDVNGDGNLDVSSANGLSNNGSILLGNGDGTFQPPTIYNIANMGSGGNSFPLATDLGDLDGDGDLDWISSNFNGNWIVLQNDGNGEFDFWMEIAAPDASSCSLMHDFDNDGDLDLALIDELENQVILSRNDGIPIADGDFDADGDLDASDINALTTVLADSGGSPIFDLTGDGQVNREDLDRWLQLGGAMNLASGAAYLPGDANLDGSVDVADFNRWNQSRLTSTSDWTAGNFNGDGVVDVADWNVWNQHKFQTAGGSTVPEPSASYLWLAMAWLSWNGQKVKR